MQVAGLGGQRALLAFDLSGLPSQGLTRATLRLHVVAVHQTPRRGEEVTAHRLLQDWTEGDGIGSGLHPEVAPEGPRRGPDASR